MPRLNSENAYKLAETVDFDLLGEELGRDVENALTSALSGGAVFPNGTNPLSIFRQTLATSIRDIESHPKGRLLQDFLLRGPYEDRGPIPTEIAQQLLTDDEATAAIKFIYSFMINCFQGAITELLTARACLTLMEKLQQRGTLPMNAKLFVGDSVMIPRASGKGVLKGADLHILIEPSSSDMKPHIVLAGIAEVKSGRKSSTEMTRQLERHIARSRHGLCVSSSTYSGENVIIGYPAGYDVLRITAQPSDWKLSRSFRFDKAEGSRPLQVDSTLPSPNEDEFTQENDGLWHISLRWSKEAIAAASYEMTFWYMEKVGEIIYSQGVPEEWGEMTPAEAGCNADQPPVFGQCIS